MKYGILWEKHINWFDSREEVINSMIEVGFVIDNGDQDCLVWENESESVNDDGYNAIGRLVCANMPIED